MTRRREGAAPRILHRDAAVIVADKPSGLPIETSSGDASLVCALRNDPGCSGSEVLAAVHRLEREASGVVVFGRTREAVAALQRLFRKGEALRDFEAIVCGYVDADGEVDLPLYYDRRLARVEANRRRGQPAVTRYRILERVAGHTLIECRAEPCRTHQVRVHLAAIGHPLAVDPVYGGGQAILLSDHKPRYRASRGRDERPLIDRLTLHAVRASFQHPDSGENLTFEAPRPRDFEVVLRQLRRLR